MMIGKLFYSASALVLLLVVLVGTTTAQEDLQGRCGDCWCIYDGELDECPTNTTGVRDYFYEEDDTDSEEYYKLYNTFEQTNDIIKLQTSDGEECYPFADSLGVEEDYPRSELPRCAFPPAEAATQVCAYLFEPDNKCQGRKYEMITYNSWADAEAAGAVVTHEGACGVCSNAQDLWARLHTLREFDVETLACAVTYLFGNRETRFQDLMDCAIEKSGMTTQCAELWAHYGAATVSKCASACPNDPVTLLPVLNGPPPQCAVAECQACSQAYTDEFNRLVGRNLVNSGITHNSAQKCSKFARIEHDPCVNSLATISPAPTVSPAPTMTPDTSTAGNTHNNNNAAAIMGAFTALSILSFFL